MLSSRSHRAMRALAGLVRNRNGGVQIRALASRRARTVHFPFLPSQVGTPDEEDRADYSIHDEDDEGEELSEDEKRVRRWKQSVTPSDDEEMDPFHEEELERGQVATPASKALLLRLGRIPYHSNVPIPQLVSERADEIAKHRTIPQLRRCLTKWMAVRHTTEELQKFRERALYWHDQVPSHSSKVTSAVVYGPEETAAYAHYLLSGRFTITKRVLQELHNALPKFQPKRVLDFGCGPATAAAAVSAMWPDAMRRYVGVDQSKAMIDAARIMTRGMAPECVFWPRSSDVLKRAAENGDRFDLAFLTYTLSDLPNDPARRVATQMVFELLDVGGMLVIIEEGNPAGSHTVRAARQAILDSFNNVDKRGGFEIRGIQHEDKPVTKSAYMMLPAPDNLQHTDLAATVVAPCTHDKPCPLAQGVWCSFSQRVKSRMIRHDSEEKFSYVIIRKVQKSSAGSGKSASAGWLDPRIPAKDGEFSPLNSTPREVLTWLDNQEAVGREQEAAELVDSLDWGSYSPPLHRSEWSRVLRSPLKAKGHLTFDVCSSEGLIRRYTHGRTTLGFVPGMYIAARKLNWGGLVPFQLNSTRISSFAGKQQPPSVSKQASQTLQTQPDKQLPTFNLDASSFQELLGSPNKTRSRSNSNNPILGDIAKSSSTRTKRDGEQSGSEESLQRQKKAATTVVELSQTRAGRAARSPLRPRRRREVETESEEL